jgi:hypothetical protein
LERVHFAWAGPIDPARGHYYRLHGPTILIEYDNTQNDANHIHTIWHDPGNAFGADQLRAHYEHATTGTPSMTRRGTRSDGTASRQPVRALRRTRPFPARLRAAHPALSYSDQGGAPMASR